MMALKEPQGPSTGEYRLLRGGSWYYYPALCRAAYRYLGSDFRDSSFGFRLLRAHD